MEYDACRIMQLVNHAMREDSKAQEVLVEELRTYIRSVVEYYGASREGNPDFACQVLSRVRCDYGKFWHKDTEFGVWIDGVLQREVESACST
jgi:hypothetical protein